MRPKDWHDFLSHIEQAQLEAQDEYPASGQHFRMVMTCGQDAMEENQRCWDLLMPHRPGDGSWRSKSLSEALKVVLERKCNGT